MIFGSQGPSFRNGFWASSSLCTLKISASAIELGVEDFFVTTGTQFSSTVSEVAVVYVRIRCQLQQLNWASWMIFGSRVLVFVNAFWASSSLCTLKISAWALEQGVEDDFWDMRDSVFINSFSVSSSLCAHKVSTSAVELGFLDDFWVPGFSFS